MKDNPLNIQVGGDHYKNDKIQHVQFCHMNQLPYVVGVSLKYIMRHRRKNGAQDLDKAKHYLQILVELSKAHPDHRVQPYHGPQFIPPVQLVVANAIPPLEAEIIYAVMNGHILQQPGSFERAIYLIDRLRENAYPPKV